MGVGVQSTKAGESFVFRLGSLVRVFAIAEFGELGFIALGIGFYVGKIVGIELVRVADAGKRGYGIFFDVALLVFGNFYQALVAHIAKILSRNGRKGSGISHFGIKHRNGIELEVGLYFGEIVGKVAEIGVVAGFGLQVRIVGDLLLGMEKGNELIGG